MRYLTSDELPEYDAKAVDIGSHGVGLASQDLWRHPVRRAHLSVVVAHKLFLIASQTEIADLDRPIVCQQNVLAFEITMEYLLGVQILQGRRQLLDYFEDLGFLKDHAIAMASVAGAHIIMKKVKDASS